MGDDLKAFGSGAKDARFEVSGGTVTVVPSVDGVGIAPEHLAEQLMTVLTQPAPRTLTAELGPVPADFTTEEAQALGIVEKVSSFTTNFTMTPSATNIRVIAEKVDGAVVKPGETFSLNDFTGPRGTAQGYVPANVIEGGHLAKAVGGGISQFATTMFNAVFFAGLQDVHHKTHSFYISRYPAGREATVFDGVDRPGRGRTTPTPASTCRPQWVSGGSITVTFWGTKHYDIESVSGDEAQRHPAGGPGQAGRRRLHPAVGRRGLRHHRHPGVQGPEARGAEIRRENVQHPLHPRGGHPLRAPPADRRPRTARRPPAPAAPADGCPAPARRGRAGPPPAAARRLSRSPARGNAAASQPLVGAPAGHRRAHWAGEHRPALGLPGARRRAARRRGRAPRAGRRGGDGRRGRRAPGRLAGWPAPLRVPLQVLGQDDRQGLAGPHPRAVGARRRSGRSSRCPPLLIGLLGSLGYLGDVIGGGSVAPDRGPAARRLGAGAHARRRRLAGPADAGRHPRLRPAGRRQPGLPAVAVGRLVGDRDLHEHHRHRLRPARRARADPHPAQGAVAVRRRHGDGGAHPAAAGARAGACWSACCRTAGRRRRRSWSTPSTGRWCSSACCWR